MRTDIEICKTVEREKLIVILSDGFNEENNGSFIMDLYFENLTALEKAVIKRILSNSKSEVFSHKYFPNIISIVSKNDSPVIYYKIPDKIEIDLNGLEYSIYENKGNITKVTTY